jgi:hypothetical protein
VDAWECRLRAIVDASYCGRFHKSCSLPGWHVMFAGEVGGEAGRQARWATEVAELLQDSICSDVWLAFKHRPGDDMLQG